MKLENNISQDRTRKPMGRPSVHLHRKDRINKRTSKEGQRELRRQLRGD